MTNYEDLKVRSLPYCLCHLLMPSFQQAAADTAKITGGRLDYLIGNAGYVSEFDAYDPIGVL